jgi:hypothetical protein
MRYLEAGEVGDNKLRAHLGIHNEAGCEDGKYVYFIYVINLAW